MKTACIILAAGEGKRMRSNIPKVMHPICGQPMIDYSVELALKRRWKIVVVIGTGKRGAPVKEHLSRRFGKKIFAYVVQDPPAGTGHAVMASHSTLQHHRGKLAILYGDMPSVTSSDLSALVQGSKKAAVAFLTCWLDDPAWYGRVVRDSQGPLCIVEHADADAEQRKIQEVNAGIYLVDSLFVFQALESVRSTNAQGEYYLTDLVAVARQRCR